MADVTGLIGLDDVIAAKEVIAGRIHRTPGMPSTALGDRAGVPLYFKGEMFQKTGSFKPRGVVNKLHRLSPEEQRLCAPLLVGSGLVIGECPAPRLLPFDNSS